MATIKQRLETLVDTFITKLNLLQSNKQDKTGSFPAAQITGVLDPAQIPVISFFKPFVSTAATIAALSTADQANITATGRNNTYNAVTLSDGSTYIYISGSKTLTASYVLLTDTTPEFSSIANRPTTAAGYGITDAYTDTSYDPGDLSNRLTAGLTF